MIISLGAKKVRVELAENTSLSMSLSVSLLSSSLPMTISLIYSGKTIALAPMEKRGALRVLRN